jgi:uncharacterized protein (TIGR02145 family)
MRKHSLLIIAACFMLTNVYCQSTLELTFTAIYRSSHVQLDEIKVINQTQGCDTLLYWPDTVLLLDYNLVGINKIKNGGDKLQVFQNYPNPVEDQTTFVLFLPENGKVNLMVTDIIGRQVINTDNLLVQGYHSFRFAPGSQGLYFLTANYKGVTSSIKILNASGNANLTSSLEYLGVHSSKTPLIKSGNSNGFNFNPGDRLLYVGFQDMIQSGIINTPETSETFTFQFANNMPCPETPTVTYGGQVYNTVQIFSQCWFRENLNVGTKISSGQNQEDNNIIEKHCFDDNETYGGLYFWDEMMNYSTQEGAQGICPDGWHIPTDEDWKILEGTVDSRYGVGDKKWDSWSATGSRGFDVGKHLKSPEYWKHYNNVIGDNSSGFSALPGGYYHLNWNFVSQTRDAFFCTSSELDDGAVWSRRLQDWSWNGVRRDKGEKGYAFSVRCIKD